MIAFTLAALFAVVATASALALADSWLRGQYAFRNITRERALLNAGFVPMVEASEVRLRSNTRYAIAATRPLPQQLPARLAALAPVAA